MDNSQIDATVENYSEFQQFLSMLGEDNTHLTNGQDAAEGLDPKFEDELYKLTLAVSPMDITSQANNQLLPKIDLQMINDIIGASQDMEVDMSTPAQEVTTGYSIQTSSPHLYDSNMGFTQQPQHEEELLQTVPVQDPSAMISGGISQQPDLLQFSLATIDQSQLQEDLSPSTLPSNTSESMSIDSTQVSGSIAAVKTVAKSSPKKGGAKTKGEEEMEQKPRVDEVPQLPDVKELLVRIRYRSKEVVRDHIKNSKGCLAFFNKPWDFQVPHENCPAGVQFPDITNEEEEGMTESQFKFTKQVLAALEKGLFLRCDDYGNVYATRFCRSKIFWYSTEKGPIADAEMSRSTPTVTFQKLERNKEVMVFDNMLFQKKLLHYVINKPTFQKEQTTNKHTIPISPAIFFTFAQSWNPLTSALSSCLVSMVVNPVKARMQRQWGNEDRHESYDLSNYRAQISSQSGLHMPEPNVTSMKN